MPALPKLVGDIIFSSAVRSPLKAIGRLFGVVPPKPTAAEIKAEKERDERIRKLNLAPSKWISKEEQLRENERRQRMREAKINAERREM